MSLGGIFLGNFLGQKFLAKATAFFTPQDPPIRVIQSKHMLIPDVRAVSLAALASTPPTRAAHGRPGSRHGMHTGYMGLDRGKDGQMGLSTGDSPPWESKRRNSNRCSRVTLRPGPGAR